MLGRGGRDGNNAVFVIMLWTGQAGWYDIENKNYSLSVTPGGRGQSKALGRVLLEQKVERQSCIREALNGLFHVKNPFSE